MSVDAYLGLVEAYIRQGDFELALEYAKKGYKATGDERLKEKADMIESGEIFDSLGRIMKRTGYDENGNVSWWHEFTYNIKGQEASIIAYDATGRETGRIEETYDKDGKVLNSYAFNNEDGEIILVKYYYQDENMVKEEWYQDTGGEILDDYWVFKYDKNGRKTGIEEYDKDEKLTGYRTYEYDENGNVVKESCFGNYEDNEEFTLYSYDLLEYDDKGNCIKRERYENNGKLTGYDFYEYDEDGIRISWEYYDSEGNLIFEE
ncbi:hypothetical protein AALA90_15105 [Lachnospiraceae bacterium 38-10]